MLSRLDGLSTVKLSQRTGTIRSVLIPIHNAVARVAAFEHVLRIRREHDQDECKVLSESADDTYAPLRLCGLGNLTLRIPWPTRSLHLQATNRGSRPWSESVNYRCLTRRLLWLLYDQIECRHHVRKEAVLYRGDC